MLNQLKVAWAPGLCKQSAEGSLIALMRRAVFSSEQTQCCSHMVPKNSQIISSSTFACLPLESMVSVFNETIPLQ